MTHVHNSHSVWNERKMPFLKYGFHLYQKLIILPEAYQVRSVFLYHVVENSEARLAEF